MSLLPTSLPYRLFFSAPCALFVIAGLLLPATYLKAEILQLDVQVVPLGKTVTGPEHVGELHYLGGLWLKSTHLSFGGFSALGSSVSGSRLVALSDHGYRLELLPEYDSDGRLTGIETAELSPLADTDGTVFASKFSRDMESLAPGANGEIIVSFERQHRLLIYTPGNSRPVAMPSPEGLNNAPLNGGIEALTLLSDGRLLAVTEALGTSEERVGWISTRDGWSPLTYTVSDGFEPTGAATLPGGDVLMLERRYTPSSGVAARIRRVPMEAIQPGAALQGSLIAEIRPPLNVDNMEGIAVRPVSVNAPSGKAVVYLISDDNFNPSEQRTLLMMFEMEDE